MGCRACWYTHMSFVLIPAQPFYSTSLLNLVINLQLAVFRGVSAAEPEHFTMYTNWWLYFVLLHSVWATAETFEGIQKCEGVGINWQAKPPKSLFCHLYQETRWRACRGIFRFNPGFSVSSGLLITKVKDLLQSKLCVKESTSTDC